MIFSEAKKKMYVVPQQQFRTEWHLRLDLQMQSVTDVLGECEKAKKESFAVGSLWNRRHTQDKQIYFS